MKSTLNIEEDITLTSNRPIEMAGKGVYVSSFKIDEL
jgi:hypothetical protein